MWARARCARVHRRWHVLDQFIREALVVRLKVIVLDELRDRPTKMMGAQHAERKCVDRGGVV